MAINLSPVAFVLKVDGDITGETYQGNFECKRLLSHRDRINKDATRRNLLGAQPEAASNDAIFRAEMLAHLGVSLTEVPKFWKESNNGLDLFDDNVVIDLYTKVTEIQAEEITKITKDGEGAKKSVKERALKKEEE
jgi:hypothetical protein